MDKPLDDSFGDPETLFNSREWLQKSVESGGAKVIGGGIGCGQGDLSILLDGCRFTVSIKPVFDAKMSVLGASSTTPAPVSPVPAKVELTGAVPFVPREKLAGDDMCPNCVTPWKCNGPHIPEGAA